MSKKQIKSSMPDITTEKLVSFSRNEDKSYKKITKIFKKDLKTGKRKLDEESESDESYILVKEGEGHDETCSLEGFDGKDMTLFFKKINNE